MIIDVSSFCQYLDAKANGIGSEDQIVVDTISVDSRSLIHNKNTLFFALEGQNHDGHLFIEQLIQKGVRYFVVSTTYKMSPPKGVVFFMVSNTLYALQKFAQFHRGKFSYPVIGITGSKGKTVVKEWLNFLLEDQFNIIKSPKSYNSQTGVPLSVLYMEAHHNLAIFEAGISQVKEMGNLQRIIQPTIGILTNITNEHQEGFTSEEQKLEEKLLLFENSDIILAKQDPKLDKLLGSKKYLTYSLTDSSAWLFAQVKSNKLELVCKDGTRFFVDLPFSSVEDIDNILLCILTMLHLGYTTSSIQERIPLLFPVELRLQLLNGSNSCTLIEDVYNAEYASLVIGLDFMEKHKSSGQKTVILSDIIKNGYDNKVVYTLVNQLLKDNKVTRLIGIGPQISKHLFSLPNTWLFESTDEFLAKVSLEDFQQETILIKGARAFRFDKIVALLEKKTHETVLEVNLTAIRHNLNFYRSKLFGNTKIMVMVKAFGYGNGSYEIAKLLSHEKVDYLGVAYTDEGIELRKSGVKTKIMVMNPEQSSFNAMLAYDLEPEIYSVHELKAFLKIARSKNALQYPIHIKLDTGMHRHGFLTHEIPELIDILQKTNIVEVKSIFSHLSSSDMPEYRDFTLDQIKTFEKDSLFLSQSLGIKPIRHILNTSGIYNFPEYQLDMVRIGIGLYGVGNDPKEMKQLQNVSTLKTKIMQIKTLDKDQSIGYGRMYRTSQKVRIATIPIGYADGIHRSWGNEKGYVIINNQKATIVGSICMDMLMVDVTDIPCEQGDTVIIFGKELPVTYIAKTINTIAYEILTSIAQRVKRIFFEE
ncbi:bifunctional UDP-N-acetylmuramoyl-tripeptide:D-alanyl-D-alanine ligase/alanine racemase [Myroides sp. LJL116]